MMFRKNVLQVVESWDGYRSQVTTNKDHSVHKLLLNLLPDDLRNWTPNEYRYKFQGSDGQGNILKAPWLATFNRDITETASKGYYLVYLLSEDLSKLVLTIGFGATQFENRYGRGKDFFDAINRAVANMRLNSAHLVLGTLIKTKRSTNSGPVELDTSGDFRLRAYEKCAIYSTTYSIKSLPPDSEMKQDYLEYLALYDKMAESLLLAEVDNYVLEDLQPKIDISPEVVKSFVPRKKLNRKSSTSQTRGIGGSYRRSKQSDKIGKLGEEWVVHYEKRQLQKVGFSNLADKVIWHREFPADRTPGWDITSFEEDGTAKYIEVKSSELLSITEVSITKKEWLKASDPVLAENFYIYLVTNITGKPSLEILRNPQHYVKEQKLKLEIESYSLNLREL